ncbi:MAG TPA: cysteine--tRNA ligase [Chloroflexi bacterium]|nr:cysteine--tRNA ligase [Chloroflexota bacterium]
MALRVYNTMTRKKEPFETLEPGVVKMYVCGPTVYDKAHVGHAMSVLVFDMVRRYLEHKGYRVRHVMNYTDVDDKIIRRAHELGEDPIALAERYIREFDQHLEDLGVLQPHVKPRVTQEIDWIIKMVKGLEDKGYAYAVDGDVYFRVTKDDDYGKLSGRKLDEMVAGARIEVDERKEHPMDFALWKAAKPGEPSWESPWGQGRPGWHIECSAMNLHHLGEQLDIHGGGADLIFPHHENEIAQSESYTGKPYVRYWMHNGMLQMGGEKMSKSLGNLVTIEDFLAEHEADVLRMMVLSSHYRSPLKFTEETITQAEKALERLRGGMRPAHANAPGTSEDVLAALDEQTEKARTGFETAMDDDFNAAAALGHLFELVRLINQARDAGATAGQLQPAQQTLRDLAGVLGLDLTKQPPQKQGHAEAAPFIDLLVEIRSDLRAAKQWALADKIRDRLTEMGVLLEDTPGGTLWRWK